MFQQFALSGGLDACRSWPRDLCDRWFFRLLVLFTVFHCFILVTSPLDLVSDEALYWEYSKHLDWSYYAKGPAIAIVTWLSTHLFGDTVFGVRIAALACFTVFSAGVYYFLRSAVSPPAALFTFAAVRCSLMFAVNGFIMTTDPLILPFWLGSLVFAYFALVNDRPAFWIPALALAGIGVLAKFTAVLLIPGYGLVLLLAKERRRHLVSLGWWAGGLAFCVAVSPIIIWNAQHEWVNLGHNVGHTVGKSGRMPFARFPELVLSQLGLVGPVLFPLLCIALWRGGRRWLKEGDIVSGLWVAATAPLLAVCVAVTATRSCYANWPLPAYVGGILLLAGEFQRSSHLRWFKRALLLNFGIFIILQLSWYLPVILPQNVQLPVPILRMSGWTELANALERSARLQQIHSGAAKPPFVLALDYMTASSLRFSVDPSIEVRLGSFAGRRLSEQDFWQTWPELEGSDAIIVGSGTVLPTGDEPLPWFKSCRVLKLEDVPPPSRLAKPFRFLLCRDYNGRLPQIDRNW